MDAAKNFEQIGAILHKELSRGGCYCEKALENAFKQFKKLYPNYSDPSQIHVAYYHKTPLSMASSKQLEVLEYYIHLESKEEDRYKYIYHYAKLSVEQEQNVYYLSAYFIDLKEQAQKETLTYSLSENKISSVSKRLKKLLKAYQYF